ncbi:MAG: DUF393 domain-containing protein [Candidatus Omnitrophica bacterium]|nr:DUF393 domain-containing protein [Candidatus Omnitrophota bacterium]
MGIEHVQTPPVRPLMIFDGDCFFCTFWIQRWQRSTGQQVEFVPSQSPRVAAQFPELPPEQLEQSVQLVEPNGAVYGGAEAVFRALAVNPRRRLGFRLYQKLPGFAPITELCYRFVANHRTAFSALTRFFLSGRRSDSSR